MWRETATTGQLIDISSHFDTLRGAVCTEKLSVLLSLSFDSNVIPQNVFTDNYKGNKWAINGLYMDFIWTLIAQGDLVNLVDHQFMYEISEDAHLTVRLTSLLFCSV